MNQLGTLLTAQAILALWLLAHACAGHWLLRRLLSERGRATLAHNPWLDAFFSTSLGIAVAMLGLFMLAAMRVLTAVTVLGTVIVILALSRSSALQCWRTRQLRWLARPEPWLVTGLYVWTVAASIRAPGYFDDTMYHLPIARHFAEQHSLAPDVFLHFPFFPQGLELLFALGLMFGHETAAQTMATLPLFIMALGLLGLSRHVFDSILPGLLSAALLLFLPFIQETLGYAYVDNGMGLFCYAAMLAVALWEDSGCRERRWLVTAGAMTGAAVSTKYFAGVIAALLGAWILLVRRDWRAAVAFVGTAILFGGGWYLRNWLVTGDPVHPAGAPIFGFYLWDEGDLLAQKKEQGMYGVTHSIRYLWDALRTAGAPEFGLALCWALFFWWSSRGLRLLFLIFVLYLLFWLYVTQVDRYLTPVSAIGCFFAVASAWKALEIVGRRIHVHGWLRLAGRAVPILGTAAALVLSWSELTAANQRYLDWQDDLERRPGYWLFVKANRLAPAYGDRLYQFGFGHDVYFFRGTVIGEFFGPGRYRDLVQCSSGCRVREPQVIKRAMERFGCRMLIINTHLFDVDLSQYQTVFDIHFQTRQGVLLTLR